MKYLLPILCLFMFSCEEKVSQEMLDAFESTKLSVTERSKHCEDVTIDEDDFSDIITFSGFVWDIGKQKYWSHRTSVSISGFMGGNQDVIYMSFYPSDKSFYTIENSSYCKFKFTDGEMFELKVSKSDFGSFFKFEITDKNTFYKLRTKEISHMRFSATDFTRDIEVYEKDFLIKKLQCFPHKGLLYE